MNYIYVIKKITKDFTKLNPSYEEGLYIRKCIKRDDMFEVVELISPKENKSINHGDSFVPTKKWNLIGYGEHDTIKEIFTKPTEEWLK